MRIRMLLLAVGLLTVAAGCWLVYLPAGLMVGGLGLGGIGLLWDDGKPKT